MQEALITVAIALSVAIIGYISKWLLETIKLVRVTAQGLKQHVDECTKFKQNLSAELKSKHTENLNNFGKLDRKLDAQTRHLDSKISEIYNHLIEQARVNNGDK